MKQDIDEKKYLEAKQIVDAYEKETKLKEGLQAWKEADIWFNIADLTMYNNPILFRDIKGEIFLSRLQNTEALNCSRLQYIICDTVKNYFIDQYEYELKKFTNNW